MGRFRVEGFRKYQPTVSENSEVGQRVLDLRWKHPEGQPRHWTLFPAHSVDAREQTVSLLRAPMALRSSQGTAITANSTPESRGVSLGREARMAVSSRQNRSLS